MGYSYVLRVCYCILINYLEFGDLQAILYVCKSVYYSNYTVCYCTATHCNTRYPLLDLLVSDDRITSPSYMEDYTPSDARMSGDGWCAESICEVESDDHYLQIDFGDEVVVEAIAIDGVEDFVYVTKYYIEYGLNVDELYCVISEESNETVSTLDIKLV